MGRSLVLGTRSAIFAPLPHLGLIILDEEQESSYQSENPPRYHAREVAQYLCAQNQATLVLGSATPSIETAYAAEQGLYRCIKLRQRYNRKALPEVMFADMKEDLRCGNGGIISASLRTELKKTLTAASRVFFSESPGQQPDAALRRVRLRAAVSPAAACR